MDGTQRLGTSRYLCAEMMRLISQSVKLCQASIGGGIGSSQTCMPQLAACALASRSYSIASLKEWRTQSTVVRPQGLSEPCIQPSMFALQVSKLCLQSESSLLSFSQGTGVGTGSPVTRTLKADPYIQGQQTQALLVSI